MHNKLIFIALLISFIAGCSNSTSQNSPQTPAEPPAANQAAAQQNNTPTQAAAQQNNTTPQPPPPPPPGSFNTAKQKPVATPPKSPTEPVSPTPSPGMEIEKAQVGSGDKGRGYDPGVITTPVATYFALQERIIFEITVPDALRAYKFDHDFKGPKTHEEFMQKVIKKYGIKLPSLPLDHRYIYDPKTEELMVEKPK